MKNEYLKQRIIEEADRLHDECEDYNDALGYVNETAEEIMDEFPKEDYNEVLKELTNELRIIYE